MLGDRGELAVDDSVEESSADTLVEDDESDDDDDIEVAAAGIRGADEKFFRSTKSTIFCIILNDFFQQN